MDISFFIVDGKLPGAESKEEKLSEKTKLFSWLTIVLTKKIDYFFINTADESIRGP
jgi:hypothetical protein